MTRRIVTLLFATAALLLGCSEARLERSRMGSSTARTTRTWATSITWSSRAGTLPSLTVVVTAAHCFSDSTSGLGTNTITDAPIVRVSFDPYLINDTNAQRNWFYGSYTSICTSPSNRAADSSHSTHTTS